MFKFEINNLVVDNTVSLALLDSLIYLSQTEL